jgi:hypothetical protein
MIKEEFLFCFKVDNHLVYVFSTSAVKALKQIRNTYYDAEFIVLYGIQ